MENRRILFEVCNCDVACPCLFLSPPTSGDSTDLLAWHIDHGRFGQIYLDGLNAVLAVHSPATCLRLLGNEANISLKNLLPAYEIDL
jgi:hypothetical protein